MKSILVLLFLSLSSHAQMPSLLDGAQKVAVKKWPVTEGRYYFQNVLFIQKDSKAKFLS